MGLEALSPDQAWSEGADLWVFANEPSAFLSRADWLLNFQISTSRMHKSPSLRPEALQIIEQTGLALQTNFLAAEKKLLISTRQFVPAKWVLVIDCNPQEWITEIHTTWKSLARPSVRAFMPKTLDSAQFQKSWNKLSNEECSISMIPTGHLKSIHPQESKD